MQISWKDFQYMSSSYFTHLHSDSNVDYSATVGKVQHIKHFGNLKKFYIFIFQKINQWSLLSATLRKILQQKA